MSKPIKKLLPYVLAFVSISILAAMVITKSKQRTHAVHNVDRIEFAKHKKPIFVSTLKEESFFGDEILIKAAIAVNQAYSDQLRFLWELPDSVRHVEGDIEGVIENVQSGQTYLVELKVKNFNKGDLKHIKIHGQFKSGDFILGSSADVSSEEDYPADPEMLKKLSASK